MELDKRYLADYLFTMPLIFNTTTIKLPKANSANRVDKLIDYEHFCNPKTDTTMVKEITVTELKAMRDSGEPHLLIDVREPHELEIAH